MKFKRYFTYLSVLIIIGTELCSSTLLAGAMFYYLMGSYITREVFPNVIRSAVNSILQQPVSMQSQLSSSQSDIVTRTGTDDAVSDMIKIGKVLGINRRLDKYMKDLWPELDCSLQPCDGKKKKKKNKEKIKAKEEQSNENDNEEEDEVSSKPPKLSASEELSGFEARKPEEDAESLADEELADEDPYNFYYIMKDQHKKKKFLDQEKIKYGDYDSREEDAFHKRFNPPFSAPKRPPSSVFPMIPTFPKPRRGSLPIFIRYKLPYPRMLKYLHDRPDQRTWNS